VQSLSQVCVFRFDHLIHTRGPCRFSIGL
jgi:hypothetical protein